MKDNLFVVFRGVRMAEALHMQIEVQRKLQEQLEVSSYKDNTSKCPELLVYLPEYPLCFDQITSSVLYFKITNCGYPSINLERRGVCWCFDVTIKDNHLLSL